MFFTFLKASFQFFNYSAKCIFSALGQGTKTRTEFIAFQEYLKLVLINKLQKAFPKHKLINFDFTNVKKYSI